eukprot:7133624-Pyramimonas_sp.AAC.1
MRTVALGPSVELPVGPRNAVLGRARTVQLGPSVELPGPRNAVLSGGAHVDGSTVTFGGAPYGATKR